MVSVPRIWRSIPSILLAASFFLPVARAYTYTPFLTPSFLFQYDISDDGLPIPITSQCETLHITWDRGTAEGPAPAPPYYLQVYTSTYLYPFIILAGSDSSFDWAVPFAPGTQYQICMFDANGNPGGCQATYTVIASPESDAPTCQNVSLPVALEVEAIVANAPMSQYQWVEQCTAISVTPKNGTPPYIFTVAPGLHPPYNITSYSMTSMSWTVSLSWGSSFFVSVVDSEGNSWSIGPLHSDYGAHTACLALDDVSPQMWVGPSVAVGVGIGGMAIGSLLGIIATYLFMEHRRRKELRGALMHVSYHSPSLNSIALPQDSKYGNVPLGTANTSQGQSHDYSLANINHSEDSGLLLNRFSDVPVQYSVEPFAVSKQDQNGPATEDEPLGSRQDRRASASPGGSLQVYTIDLNTKTASNVSNARPGVVEVEPAQQLGEASRNDRAGPEEKQALLGGTVDDRLAGNDVALNGLLIQPPSPGQHSRRPKRLSKPPTGARPRT